MTEVPRISAAEWEVMRVVWEHGPVSAREIVEGIADDRGWTEATVKTLINRLCKKRVLLHEVEGRRYLYRAAIQRDVCVRSESRSFIDKVFGGSASPLIAHFLEEGALDDDELASLRRLLDEKGDSQ